MYGLTFSKSNHKKYFDIGLRKMICLLTINEY